MPTSQNPITASSRSAPAPESSQETESIVIWLEQALPRIIRRIMDAENLELPLLQLPLAQMRLAQALYAETDEGDIRTTDETMGRLSERLGVRQNAMTQAANRLVQRGLAERFSDPTDRRIVRLRLTKLGCEWVAARSARRRAHLGQLWAALEPQEREDFLQAVRVLEATGNRIKKDEG